MYGYLVHIIAEATQQRQMNLSVCTSMNKAAQGQHQRLSYAHSRRQQQTETVHIPNICPKAATNSTVCTSLKGQQRTALCALPSNKAMFKAATNSDYIHGGRETSMISEPVRKAATASAGDTSLLKKRAAATALRPLTVPLSLPTALTVRKPFYVLELFGVLLDRRSISNLPSSAKFQQQNKKGARNVLIGLMCDESSICKQTLSAPLSWQLQSSFVRKSYMRRFAN